MEDDDAFESSGDDRKRAKAKKSAVAAQIRAILTNRPWEGRKVVSLTPTTRQEWDHAFQAMHDAHKQKHPRQTELLKAMRRFQTTANEAAAQDKAKKTSSITEAQKHALMAWRAPDWEHASVWNPSSGVSVVTGYTRGEVRNQRVAGGNRATRIRQAISDRLGLSPQPNIPHPHLGEVSSPRHIDHPAVWAEWVKHFAKGTAIPRGFIMDENGYPLQRHVRSFLRLQPLFRGSASPQPVTHHVQVHVMSLLARRYVYSRTLRTIGRAPNPVPDWNPIVWDDSMSIDDTSITHLLAEHGLSEDDADDASAYARYWLSDVQVVETDATLLRIISDTLGTVMPSGRLPYTDDMQFAYHEAYGRWVPVQGGPVAGSELPGNRSVVTVPPAGNPAQVPSGSDMVVDAISSAGAGAPMQENPTIAAPPTNYVGPTSSADAMDVLPGEGTAEGSN
jgi:hypothetical protein